MSVKKELFKPKRRELEVSFQIVLIIHIYLSKSNCVAIRPFKTVRKGPFIVALHINTFPAPKLKLVLTIQYEQICLTAT